MAVTEQFAGLDMEQLISAPLAAAVEAGIRLADETAQFIKTVGVDEQGRVRNTEFRYMQHTVDEAGEAVSQEMKVDVPLLAIVPVPNLHIDEVNLLFDIEVKQSETKDSTMELSAKGDGSLGFGPAKVTISGAVSTYQTNARKSDYSAKYHIDIRAANHGTPEALARVIDMMSESLTARSAPAPLSGSKSKVTTKIKKGDNHGNTDTLGG